MSLVKDLVDLVTQLDQSVTNRRVRDMILPIKEKALEVQHEHLAIETELLESERKTFETEKRHAKEIDEINQRSTNTIAKLQAEIDELKSQLDAYQTFPEADFSEESGTWVDGSTGLHYCPQCRPFPSPMQIHKSTYPPGRNCGRCNCFREDIRIPMEA